MLCFKYVIWPIQQKDNKKQKSSLNYVDGDSRLKLAASSPFTVYECQFAVVLFVFIRIYRPEMLTP